MAVSRYTWSFLSTVLTSPDTLIFVFVSLGGTFALNLLCNEIYNAMTNGPTWVTVTAFVIPSIVQIAIFVILMILLNVKSDRMLPEIANTLPVRSNTFPAISVEYFVEYLVNCCTDDKDYDEIKDAMEHWRSNDRNKPMFDLASRMDDFMHLVRVCRIQNRKVAGYRCSHLVQFIVQPFLILLATAPGNVALNLFSSYVSDLLKHKEEWRTVVAFEVPLTIQIATGLVWWFLKPTIERKVLQKFQSFIRNCAPEKYEMLKNYVESGRQSAKSAIKVIVDPASHGSAAVPPEHCERNVDTEVLKGVHETISTPRRRRGSRKAANGTMVVERDREITSEGTLHKHKGSTMDRDLQIKDVEGNMVRPTRTREYSIEGLTVVIREDEGTRNRPTIICRDDNSPLAASWLKTIYEKTIYEKYKSANILPEIYYFRNPVHPCWRLLDLR